MDSGTGRRARRIISFAQMQSGQLKTSVYSPLWYCGLSTI